MKLFVFTDNLVFEGALFYGTSKIPLLFEFVFMLHQVQIRGELILHVIHIADTRMTETGIYGLSRGDNLGEMMKGMNPLQFIVLYQGLVVKSAKLEPWISNWWGKLLTSLSVEDYFEHKGDNIQWDPPISASETALESLLESRLHQ